MEGITSTKAPKDMGLGVTTHGEDKAVAKMVANCVKCRRKYKEEKTQDFQTRHPAMDGNVYKTELYSFSTCSYPLPTEMKLHSLEQFGQKALNMGCQDQKRVGNDTLNYKL